MAPAKFGLFKSRSREQPDQPPSTENLLQNSNSFDNVGTPVSPIPSTSKGLTDDFTPEDICDLRLDSEDDEASEKKTPVRRTSHSSKMDDFQVNYHPLKNQSSHTDMSTVSTAHDHNHRYDDGDSTLALEIDNDGASTSADCNSLQFDETSIAPSEDLSVYCGTMKRPKKSRSKEEKQLRDFDMWQASNVEVMQNLLSRSGTLDDQIKWEAIATARGLCTLTDSCTCPDCKRSKFLAYISDGDGGLGAAPFFNTINVGCSIQ